MQLLIYREGDNYNSNQEQNMAYGAPPTWCHSTHVPILHGGRWKYVCVCVYVYMYKSVRNMTEYRNTFNQLLYVSKQAIYIFKIVTKMSIKITVKKNNKKLRLPLSPLHTMHCLSSSHTGYDDVPLRHDCSGHKSCCLGMCLLKLLGRVWKVED